MLFTSNIFIWGFLPTALSVFFIFGHLYGKKAAAIWLALASLFFYGWWDIRNIPLLLGSILFNYSAGLVIAHCIKTPKNLIHARLALIIGLVGNLLFLTYYKYSAFFLRSVNEAFDSQFEITNVILPLGISFFTFTQIAFLVDTWRGKAKEYSLIHYVLFVTWFPHLIAGPVLHHGQMMPQFRHNATYNINSKNISVGLSLFSTGLAKKLLIADSISPYADLVFGAVANGKSIDIFVAWAGTLAYTFQIYFDFSGYSDMAVGLSMLFGIRLPINFNSPYKSINIIEFWRRWHMTLSQFLRDYLYIPLGGNRHGNFRRYFNLLATMVLGGLWHGAAWTFVIWGGLHGLYLCINHLWQAVRRGLGMGAPSLAGKLAGALLTFVGVVVAWVFFRAESLTTANLLIGAMFNTAGTGADWASVFGDLSPSFFAMFLMLCFGIIWLMPNTYEAIELFTEELAIKESIRSKHLLRAAGITIGVCCASLFFFSLVSTFGAINKSPFLYFQF
jgi:alginate O-acetyltransferase complex protein AlgI